MKWIECKDLMPTTDEYVIVCNANESLVFIGKRTAKHVGHNFEDVSGNITITATHWMPIPEMPKQQLKPCPFCGFTAIYTGYLSDGHWVECTHCRCRTRGFDTKYEAGKQWNKRCDNG